MSVIEPISKALFSARPLNFRRALGATNEAVIPSAKTKVYSARYTNEEYTARRSDKVVAEIERLQQKWRF
jgi:hypothetical protein